MGKEYSKKPAIQRFLSKIKINDETGCWEWTDSVKIDGYGQFKVKGNAIVPHRYIFEYYHGMICPDLAIDHLCRNRACMNVNHLEQVSIGENVLRGIGITAINARKTHCKRGHEFTEKNTYRRAINKRECRICHKEYNKRWQQKIRGELI